jgi:anti-sigma factor (TIGR02949 family)
MPRKGDMCLMKNNDKNKFDCEDIEKAVQAYMDNQLSEDELLAFEDHLGYCLPCDKKIEFELKLKEIVKHKAIESTYPKTLEEELKKIIKGN